MAFVEGGFFIVHSGHLERDGGGERERAREGKNESERERWKRER